MPVSMKAEDKERYVLLTLEGEGTPEWSDIDALAEPALKVISTKAIIYKRNPKIIAGSVEISLMLRIHKKAKQLGDEMCLCEIDKPFEEVLKLTALDQLWPTYATLEEAEQHIPS